MNKISKVLLGVIIFLLAISFTSCYTETANQKEAAQVNQNQEQLVNGQPAPSFTSSLERQEMIEIYIARNNAVKTYSVVYNPFLGVLTFECPSYGYPIPGGTQLTNSESIYYSGNGNVTLPQAEPNGLYTPPTSAGTYVMCRSLENGTAYPIYIEENVMTFPYVVMIDSKGRLVKADNSEPSININVTKAGSNTTP